MVSDDTRRIRELLAAQNKRRDKVSVLDKAWQSYLRDTDTHELANHALQMYEMFMDFCGGEVTFSQGTYIIASATQNNTQPEKLTQMFRNSSDLELTLQTRLSEGDIIINEHTLYGKRILPEVLTETMRENPRDTNNHWNMLPHQIESAYDYLVPAAHKLNIKVSGTGIYIPPEKRVKSEVQYKDVQFA